MFIPVGYLTGSEEYYTHMRSYEGGTGLDIHDDLAPDWNATGIYSTYLFAERAKKIISNHNKTKVRLFVGTHVSDKVADGTAEYIRDKICMNVILLSKFGIIDEINGNLLLVIYNIQV